MKILNGKIWKFNEFFFSRLEFGVKTINRKVKNSSASSDYSNLARIVFRLKSSALFPPPPPPPPPPTSRQFQLISVTSGFTRLSMKTKYVCRGLIGLYLSFHNNQTMWSTNLHVKICKWGGGRKRSQKFQEKCLEYSNMRLKSLLCSTHGIVWRWWSSWPGRTSLRLVHCSHYSTAPTHSATSLSVHCRHSSLTRSAQFKVKVTRFEGHNLKTGHKITLMILLADMELFQRCVVVGVGFGAGGGGGYNFDSFLYHVIKDISLKDTFKWK